MLARWAARPMPAVQGHPARIERMELSGALSARDVTTLVLRLRALARDPAVRALVVSIDGVDAGWGTVHELRAELEKLGRSDILVVVGGVIPPQDYDALLAAGATAIYPPGTVIADAAVDLIAKLNRTLGYPDPDQQAA